MWRAPPSSKVGEKAHCQGYTATQGSPTGLVRGLLLHSHGSGRGIPRRLVVLAHFGGLWAAIRPLDYVSGRELGTHVTLDRSTKRDWASMWRGWATHLTHKISFVLFSTLVWGVAWEETNGICQTYG